MKTPALSVVVPCFDAGELLPECLDSLLSQTLVDFELVLVDDGSRDDTAAIADAYAQRDPRVCVIRSAHVGIVEALRRGCEVAQGAYLARMDADDVALPARLAEQFAFMEAHPDVALCGCQVELFGERIGTGRARYAEWMNGLVEHEAMTRELFVECPVPHPTFMMRRDAFDAVGGYVDAGWPEDYDLVMRLHCAGYRLGKVVQPLLRWRHTESRLSMTDPRYSPEQFRALKRHYLDKTYLANRSEFYQWGAGEVGKPWLREWGTHAPKAVVDIHPRKIGRTIHGAPVIAPEGLPGHGEAFTVVAVGAPGAREEIRAWFSERGYTELVDYLFLA